MMLDGLTAAESDLLWWRLVRATAAAADEIDCLELAPVTVRDMLYGAGCLEQYRAMRDELAALADELAETTTPKLTAVVSDTPEEGSQQWHSSDDVAAPPPMTWSRLASRVTLARALRRLTPPTWWRIHPR